MDNISEMTRAILNRYRLNIPSCPYPLDVKRFEGLEQMSALYHYTIRYKCPHPDLTTEMMLNKIATLSMGMGELFNTIVGKIVHCVVTGFRRVSGSHDQVAYEIILEPFISLLGNQHHTHRFSSINRSRKRCQRCSQSMG